MSEDIKDELGNVKQKFLDLINNRLYSKHMFNYKSSNKKILKIIKKIPDKIVRDDILSAFIYEIFIGINQNIKLPTNLFNDIYEGKVLHPDTVGLSYGFDSNNRLKLYGGGFGMGHYHEVSFDSSTQQYIYTLLTNANKERNDLYTHSNWDEFRSLIFNHIMHN